MEWASFRNWKVVATLWWLCAEPSIAQTRKQKVGICIRNVVLRIRQEKNISNLVQLLGDDLCDAFLGVLAFNFSEYDSVTAFIWWGKSQHSQICQSKQDIPRVLQIPGKILKCIRGIIYNMEPFVCRLHALSSSVVYVMSMICVTGCSAPKEVEFSPFPLCRDCLQLHIQYANYHAAV